MNYSTVSILDFAYRLGFKSLYDWQCKMLLRYEAGEPVAAACANYTGKTSAGMRSWIPDRITTN